MKTNKNATVLKATSVVTFALLATVAHSAAQEQQIPAVPVGWLTASPTVVQTGTKPTLTWGVTHPSTVKNYIDITDPSTITAREELEVKIRVLGNGVTVSSSNSNSFSYVDAEANVSFNGGSYERIFYGDNHDVNPSKVVWKRNNNKKMEAGETLRFGGRYNYNNKWGPTRTTSSGSYVRALVDGDTPPSVIPEYGDSLEDFIKPYLGSDGKVKIGPMDVIIFMELTHNDNQQNNNGYDLQDMVLLVTFTSNKPKNNNGHGNNVDGIDSSNPGNAPFMQYDTDPTVDDEG